MKKIPVQLYSDQWKRFRTCLADCIFDIDQELKIIKDKEQIVYLRLIASLLNEVLIKIDVILAKQGTKNTLPLTIPQALALHSAYTDLYLLSKDNYFANLLQTKIIPIIDKAAV